MSAAPGDRSPKTEDSDAEKAPPQPVATDIPGDGTSPGDIVYPSGAGLWAVVAALALTMLLVRILRILLPANAGC